VSKFTGLCSAFSLTSNIKDQYGPGTGTAWAAGTGRDLSPWRKVGNLASSAGAFFLA
jgi:hypothetical protein